MSGIVRGEWFKLDQMVSEIDRVTDAARIVPSLDVVLSAAFAESRERISAPGHAHTPDYDPRGVLLASGRSSSSYDPAGRVWEGEIEYPGAAGHFEQLRGGDHDMFATQPLFDYREAVHDFWEAR